MFAVAAYLTYIVCVVGRLPYITDNAEAVLCVLKTFSFLIQLLDMFIVKYYVQFMWSSLLCGVVPSQDKVR